MSETQTTRTCRRVLPKCWIFFFSQIQTISFTSQFKLQIHFEYSTNKCIICFSCDVSVEIVKYISFKTWTFQLRFIELSFKCSIHYFLLLENLNSWRKLANLSVFELALPIASNKRNKCKLLEFNQTQYFFSLSWKSSINVRIFVAIK